MTISASQLRLSNNLENDGSGGLRIASALAAFGLLRTGAFTLAVDSANLVGAGMEVDGGGLFQIAESAAGNGLAGGGGGALTVDQDYAFNLTGFHGTLDADLAAGGHEITGLATPTTGSSATTKSYVDAIAAMGVAWKECLLDTSQLQQAGLRSATVMWMGQPVDGDTLTITDGVNTRTYGAVSGGDVQYAIGGTPEITMTNLSAAIDGDVDGANKWRAAFLAVNFRKLNDGSTGAAAGGGLLITRKDTSGITSDRLYGTFATAGNVKYANYAGKTDYSSSVSAQLPGADPAAKQFGFGKNTVAVQGETRSILAQNIIVSWDGDGANGVGSWQQMDAGAVGAGNGMVRNGSALDVVCTDNSISVGADAIGVKIKGSVSGYDAGVGVDGAGVFVKIADKSIVVDGQGIKANLKANFGLELDAVNGLATKVSANAAMSVGVSGLGVIVAPGYEAGVHVGGGLGFDGADGLMIKIQPLGAGGGEGLIVDAGSVLNIALSGGTLTKVGGLKVSTAGIDTNELANAAVTPGKLGFTRTREGYADTGWTYVDSVNSRAVGATPNASIQILQDQVFMRNGVETGFKRVSGAPVAEGEWRLNGTTLEVYSAASFGASGDNFTAKYHA